LTNDPIKSLIHLYEDGAFNRRELITRLTKYTGSIAAATALVESTGLAQQPVAGCLTNVRVSENDPSVFSQMLTIHGEGGPLFVYQSLPRDYASGRRPAVLVIHENRGLNDHILDVNRRVAKAGYVALAVDLLSRQGGTSQFPDPVQATAAYNRTTVEERRQDMLSALLTIRDQVYVAGNRLGVIGFCAGGGNVWDLAVNTDQLSASVIFYGPPPPVEQLANLNAPVLGLFAEQDRGITGRLGPVLTALNDGQKPYELHIYQNARHAFHNDTGASYEPTAACDAWQKTLTFFARHLNTAGA
jgi:carboxymethylenebutenolidase